MGIKIITDSTCYLPQTLCETYGITILSLHVMMSGKNAQEVDLDNASFYEEMANALEIPTSSQPSPKTLFDTFEQAILAGDSVVGIFLSSDMSGTYQSAHLVRDILRDTYPDADIALVDSRSNCMQMGYAVLEGAKVASRGGSMEDVLARVDQVIHNSQFVFTPDTLDYLKKGGRIGGASALLGNLLQIKPILTVQDGKTAVLTKVRTKHKAIVYLIDTFVDFIGDASLGDVIVHHINCEAEGLALAHALEQRIGRPVAIQSIGPVIGLHVGPGSIGLAYFREPQL